MKPEELFKIEDVVIPDVNEEDISTENIPSNEKIDIFKKDLTIEDILEFLNKNNLSTNESLIEKYYEEIITNNQDKQIIVDTIKELDVEKEILVQQIEKEPDNRVLLKKISDIDEKISELNTAERVKEDNVKNIIKNIVNINSTETIEKIADLNSQEDIKRSETPEIISENPATSQTPEIVSENPILSETPEIVSENPATSQTPEIVSENSILSETPEIISENPATSQTPEIKTDNIFDNIVNQETESLKKDNAFENLKEVDEDNPNIMADSENINTLKEIEKNNKMLQDLSKDINNNFEILFKNLENIGQNKEVEEKKDIQEIEPSYVENPKISQKNYIEQYRDSLRKNSGIGSFLGFDTEFKADNLGSYI